MTRQGVSSSTALLPQALAEALVEICPAAYRGEAYPLVHRELGRTSPAK
jgi:hypothetical protein